MPDDLCVFIPTRHRRARAGECIRSFRETVDGDVDLFLVVDEDDDSYQDMDVPVITVPHESLTTAINRAARWLSGEYRALFLGADDLVFKTPGWNRHLLRSLELMGGSGWVFPDDKRRYDVPEHPLISSDIVRFLGWFAEPSLGHFFVDNCWAELGKRSGLIRYCPEAVIEHQHYTTHPEIERDAMYTDAEKDFGKSDMEAFKTWQADRMAGEVARLRREFSQDLSWVLSLI